MPAQASLPSRPSRTLRHVGMAAVNLRLVRGASCERSEHLRGLSLTASPLSRLALFPGRVLAFAAGTRPTSLPALRSRPRQSQAPISPLPLPLLHTAQVADHHSPFLREPRIPFSACSSSRDHPFDSGSFGPCPLPVRVDLDQPEHEFGGSVAVLAFLLLGKGSPPCIVYSRGTLNWAARTLTSARAELILMHE
jgi:hypothetical protein